MIDTLPTLCTFTQDGTTAQSRVFTKFHPEKRTEPKGVGGSLPASNLNNRQTTFMYNDTKDSILMHTYVTYY